MDLSAILKDVSDIARETGSFIRQRQKGLQDEDIFSKGTHDYVTEVDRESERKLVEKLSGLIPDCGFLTEEKTTEQKTKEFTWIIDPLDGTTNFMHGAPPFAVSIALAKESTVILGVVYEITGDELFTASAEGPAQLNGISIRVSGVNTLEKALIATGFPFINYDRLEPYMDVLKHYMIHTQGIRRLGSAATDLVYVACGRYDGFYEYNLNPWDIAAGTLIVTRAGGRVTDFSGGEKFLFGKELAATNGYLHNSFLEPIKRFLAN